MKEIRLFNKININFASLIDSNTNYYSFDFVLIPMIYFGYRHHNKNNYLGINKSHWLISANWLFWGITIDNDEPFYTTLGEENESKSH